MVPFRPPVFCRLAASWSTGPRPLTPWMRAYTTRLVFALVAIGLVYFFPTAVPTPYYYFLLVVGFTVLQSFTRCGRLGHSPTSNAPSTHTDKCLRVTLACSTIQFVGISAFHTQISDPRIGGTYMTVGIFSSLLTKQLLTLWFDWTAPVTLTHTPPPPTLLS